MTISSFAMTLRGRGRGPGFNVIMTLIFLKIVWKCPLTGCSSASSTLFFVIKEQWFLQAILWDENLKGILTDEQHKAFFDGIFALKEEMSVENDRCSGSILSILVPVVRGT